MANTRSQLLTRKSDLLAALRLLEHDRADGTIEEPAYEVARKRYEEEAATVLEQLDTLQEAPVTQRPEYQAIEAATRRRSWPIIGGASVLVLAALVLFLVAATHGRSLGGSITGSQPATPATGVAGAPPQLLAAQRAARSHPRSVAVLVRLGNAYLQDNQTNRADATFRSAMTLAPGNPEPTTLHAMIVGANGHPGVALGLLSRVESQHPRYSRAWLLDWLLSTRSPTTRARAVTAAHRFLALEPRASFDTAVRRWLKAEKRAKR